MTTSKVYSPEVIKILDFIEEAIADGLEHGFFELGIKCETKKGGLREVVVKAGRTHKFNVPADCVPQ